MDPAGMKGEGFTLLYVEDEGPAREMVRRMLLLNYPGLTVLSAENGAVGLSLYREYAPQIVVTDINMPVMDGIRMSREIKAGNRDCVIVAVTAHSDTAYLMNAIEIGINRYVLKPLDYEELFRVVDGILEELDLRRIVAEQNLRLTQSERQLSEAQKIAHLGSWQWELPAGEMRWSDELYRIMGLEPGSVPSSMKDALARVHRDDREEVEEAICEIQDRGYSSRPLFFRVLRPDGSCRVVRGQAELIRDPQGKGISIIGSAHDVTEIKEAEEKIRSLTAELEQRVLQRTSQLQATVRELESFSYTVSHDLRGPVARLEGFCQALVEDCHNCPDRNCPQYAKRAEQAVLQIKRIIDSFNGLSHFARCRLVVEEVDLSRLATEVAHGLSEGDPARQGEFVVAPGLVVLGDPRLLRVVVENLLGNAWKFTCRKEVARIEFGAVLLHGERVFFVRDNGAGFDMRYAEKLFRPFQTLHSPGEYLGTDTATGLAAVHTIVNRHGGKVWGEGVVEGGATFYFTLSETPEPQSYLPPPG